MKKKFLSCIALFGAITLGAVTLSACGNDNGGTVQEDTYDVTVTSDAGATAELSSTKAKEGETVTVTITVKDGYEFVSALSDQIQLTTVTKGSKYTFIMPAEAVSITVKTKQIEIAASYKLSVTTDDGATATLSSETAKEGETVTLTITLKDGYDFVSATSSEVTLKEVTAGSKYTFTMPAKDVSITVTTKKTVEEGTYKVSVTTDDGATATLSSETAKEGETVTLTITLKAGYKFVSATSSQVTLEEVTAGSEYTFTMPASDVAISVTTAVQTYSIQATGDVGGSVSLSKTEANAGETITVELTINDGYGFKSLTSSQVTFTEVTVGQTYTFVMPASDVSLALTTGQIQEAEPCTFRTAFKSYYAAKSITGIEDGQTYEAGSILNIQIIMDDSAGMVYEPVLQINDQYIELKPDETNLGENSGAPYIFNASYIYIGGELKAYAFNKGNLISEEPDAKDAVTINIDAVDGVALLGILSGKKYSLSTISYNAVVLSQDSNFLLDEAYYTINEDAQKYTFNQSYYDFSNASAGDIITIHLLGSTVTEQNVSYETSDGSDLSSYITDTSVLPTTILPGTNYEATFTLANPNDKYLANVSIKDSDKTIAPTIMHNGDGTVTVSFTMPNVENPTLVFEFKDTIEVTIDTESQQYIDSIVIYSDYEYKNEVTKIIPGNAYYFKINLKEGYYLKGAYLGDSQLYSSGDGMYFGYPEDKAILSVDVTQAINVTFASSNTEAGTITVPGGNSTITTAAGEEINLTITVNDGYTLSGFTSSDGSNVSYRNTFGSNYYVTIPNTTEDITITANFIVKEKVSITFNKDENYTYAYKVNSTVATDLTNVYLNDTVGIKVSGTVDGEKVLGIKVTYTQSGESETITSKDYASYYIFTVKEASLSIDLVTQEIVDCTAIFNNNGVVFNAAGFSIIDESASYANMVNYAEEFGKEVSLNTGIILKVNAGRTVDASGYKITLTYSDGTFVSYENDNGGNLFAFENVRFTLKEGLNTFTIDPLK